MLKNESLLAVKVDEYQKAMKNIESIVVAIRNNDVYKDALKNGQDTLIAEEEIYIELNDEDSIYLNLLPFWQLLCVVLDTKRRNDILRCI